MLNIFGKSMARHEPLICNIVTCNMVKVPGYVSLFELTDGYEFSSYPSLITTKLQLKILKLLNSMILTFGLQSSSLS